MVSRWNYIAITAVMAVTFFLFQFTNVMLESWNHYEENTYVRDLQSLPGRNDAYVSGQDEDGENGRGTVLYVGGTEEMTGKTVRAWAAYAKKNLVQYDTWEQFAASDWLEKKIWPEMIVLNGKDIVREEQAAYLKTCAAQGVGLIFANLPAVSVIEQSAGLKQLLGIAEIRAAETAVDGIHLQAGFFLGGEAVYYTEDEEENARRQDMELTMPWYTLTSGTEVYMNGMFADSSIEEEELPAVIWRNVANGTDVFAVNGSYMEEADGLGILSAMYAGMHSYTLYPVVNAQNLVAANYPGLSDENEDAVMRRYGKSTAELFRDTVWPAVIAVYRQNTLGLTCMLAPQFDYEDDSQPDLEQFLYYMQRLNEERAETGLSGCSVSDTPVAQKLKSDQTFMEGALPEYRFTSFYAGELDEETVESALREEMLSDVRTVAAAYDGSCDVVGYQNEKVTRQSILTDGVRHTYREDFRNRSVETALGYTSVLADLSQVAYPDEGLDALTALTSYLGWNIRHDMEGFSGFEGTTLSESDGRIRSFLSLDYTQYRENNNIYLTVENVKEPVWFILRCRGEAPRQVQGGNWKRLERDVYLIEVQEQNAVVTLKAGRN